MAKMKIYEIARSIQGMFPELKSKDLVELLNQNGFEVKSPQSSIEDEAIAFLMGYYKKKAAQAKTASKEKAEPQAASKKEAEKKETVKKETVEKKEPEKKEEKKETVAVKQAEKKKETEKKPEVKSLDKTNKPRQREGGEKKSFDGQSRNKNTAREIQKIIVRVAARDAIIVRAQETVVREIHAHPEEMEKEEKTEMQQPCLWIA